MDLRRADQVRAIMVYISVIASGNLVWETLQLPLYTIWTTGSAREQAFAVVHCTGGDVLIALSTLAASLLLLRCKDWPKERFGQVALLAIGFGVAYTGFSEWFNVHVRRSWAYSEWMPVLPIAGGIGLAPLLQWALVPTLAHWLVWARFGAHHRREA